MYPAQAWRPDVHGERVWRLYFEVAEMGFACFDVRQALLLGSAAAPLLCIIFWIKPHSAMKNSEHQGDSTEALIASIDALLHSKRSTLPADAERLLRLSRDELKEARSDPPDSERPSSAVARAIRYLTLAFAKKEVIDCIGDMDERFGEIADQLSELL